MSTIFKSAKILLPNDDVDMNYWPSLACDQFTSEPDYWQNAEELCNDKKSTLHLTLPEIYLENDNVDEKINKITQNMKEYENNVLTKTIEGFIYTNRYFNGKQEPLCGIVGTVDLEQYSYEKGALPAIRPSENTVVARIPPRLKVRKNACLELPHILMLIDDSEHTVIEPLEQKKSTFPCVYDTKLMLEGGKITGYAVQDSAEIERIENAVKAIGSAQVFDAKYPLAKGSTPLAMAVGDGNHSLATAKAHWQEVKKGLSENEALHHPARYCLVELVNIHSKAIEIEPIHRVIFGADLNNLKGSFTQWLQKKGALCKICNSANVDSTAQNIKIVNNGNSESFVIENSPYPLAVGTVEAFLDEFCAQNKALNVDYIHGEDVVFKLAKDSCVGVILPEFEKSDIFKGVVLGGVLPRKTFSMGTAREKRYYLECRKIV